MHDEVQSLGRLNWRVCFDLPTALGTKNRDGGRIINVGTEEQ